MRASTRRLLRSGWPLVLLLFAILTGLAVGGFGDGVLTGMLAILVVGPAYLIQNQVRRGRGTLVTPPKTSAEGVQTGARILRAGAVSAVVTGLIALGLALSNGMGLLTGREWTALFAVETALAAMSAPHLWALAELSANKRTVRWLWTLGAAISLAVGVTALVSAVTNQDSHWIGGSAWTAGLAVLGVSSLLSAAGNLSRTRH